MTSNSSLIKIICFEHHLPHHYFWFYSFNILFYALHWEWTLRTFGDRWQCRRSTTFLLWKLSLYRYQRTYSRHNNLAHLLFIAPVEDKYFIHTLQHSQTFKLLGAIHTYLSLPNVQLRVTSIGFLWLNLQGNTLFPDADSRLSIRWPKIWLFS